MSCHFRFRIDTRWGCIVIRILACMWAIAPTCTCDTYSILSFVLALAYAILKVTQKVIILEITLDINCSIRLTLGDHFCFFQDDIRHWSRNTTWKAKKAICFDEEQRKTSGPFSLTVNDALLILSACTAQPPLQSLTPLNRNSNRCRFGQFFFMLAN